MVNNINNFISTILWRGDKFLTDEFKNILNNLKYNLAISQNFITPENINYFYFNFLNSVHKEYKISKKEKALLDAITKHIQSLKKKVVGK